MNREIIKKNLYVSISVFLSSFMICILGINKYHSEIYDVVSNNLYPENVLYYIQEDYAPIDEVIKQNNIFISKEINENMRGIFFTSNYHYELPVLEGRFFTYRDFLDEKNYILLGKNLKDKIYYDNGKTLYSFNENTYEVIGILGINSNSRLDNMIIFNLLNIYDDAPIYTKVALHNANNEEFVNVNFKKLDIDHEGINRIWSNSNIYYYLNFIVYICSIITIFFLMILKSSYYSKYFRIFNMLGFTKKYSFVRIFKIETLILIFSYFCSIPISFLLVKHESILNNHLLQLILKYFVMSFFAVQLSTMIIIYKKVKLIYKRERRF